MLGSNVFIAFVPFRNTFVVLHKWWATYQGEDCIDVKNDARILSSRADGEFVAWTNTASDDEGKLEVSFPNAR